MLSAAHTTTTATSTMINFDSSKHQPHHGLVSVGPGSADWPCWQYTYKEAGTCYVKTAAQAQQLPIVGMDTEACDPYSMQPHFWLPVRLDAITWFFAFTGQGHHALGCAQQLAQAIQEADVSPGSPSFRQRCTFCKANPYLCDETQLNLCRLHAQAHRANARNKGAFSDSTLNAFNLLLASSACARGPLESVCGSRAMTPWAVLIDQWRLWIAVAYWAWSTADMVIEISAGQVALLNNGLGMSWLSWLFWKITFIGHFLPLTIIIVLDSISGDGGARPGRRELAQRQRLADESSWLAGGFVAAAAETYLAYLWSGAAN